MPNEMMPERKPDIHPDQRIEPGQSDFRAEMQAEGKQIYTMPDGSQTMPLTKEEYKDALESYRDNQGQ